MKTKLLSNAALVISTVFSPYIVLIIVSISLSKQYFHHLDRNFHWLSAFYLCDVVLPISFVILMLLAGKIKDHHISARQERHLPFVVTCILAIFGQCLIYHLKADTLLIAFGLIYTINAVTICIMTFFWKVSVHAAVLAASITAMLLLFDPGLIWLYFLLIPLGWSRIYRGKHTAPQLISGAIVAIFTSITTMSLFTPP